MSERMHQQFPALQARKSRLADAQKVDQVCRVLLRALQNGSLSEEEFATTLERLELATGPSANAPAALESHGGAIAARVSAAGQDAALGVNADAVTASNSPRPIGESSYVVPA
jgi:hypothetical protein